MAADSWKDARGATRARNKPHGYLRQLEKSISPGTHLVCKRWQFDSSADTSSVHVYLDSVVKTCHQTSGTTGITRNVSETRIGGFAKFVEIAARTEARSCPSQSRFVDSGIEREQGQGGA